MLVHGDLLVLIPCFSECRQAYDLGGEKRAFAVMKNYFAQKEKGTGAEREAAVLTSTGAGARGVKVSNIKISALRSAI